MRMPNSRQISDEQEDIYAEAPMDGSIIIIGPPGTGKTVIAFLRAQALQRRNKVAQVIMFNNTLKKFTENVAVEGDGLKPLTHFTWVREWWKSNGIKTQSGTKDKTYLDCPYDQKDEAKALGAKWDKFKKKWYVSQVVLKSAEGGLDKWINIDSSGGDGDINPPKITEFNYDWTAMLVAAASHPNMNDWGHLIIDEGQDFPKEMYSFLRFVSDKVPDGSLTIMADENQRLNEEENSTVEQIKSALAVGEDRFYRLEQNFRNTRQIATLANTFFVGLASGVPTLPKKQGDLPQVIKAKNLEEQVDYIARILSARAPGEVGVFVQNDNMRKKVYDLLQYKLKEQYRVQTYSSKDQKNHPVDDLVFDTSGTLTVINRHSCKGLEFDFVFIPELQSIDIDGSSLDTFKMNMYVMCSRAREALYMLYSTSTGKEVEVMQYLPSIVSNLVEYKNV